MRQTKFDRLLFDANPIFAARGGRSVGALGPGEFAARSEGDLDVTGGGEDFQADGVEIGRAHV